MSLKAFQDYYPEQLYFSDRNDWRAWLEHNHAIASEAWLIHYKKHTGKLGLSLEEAAEGDAVSTRVLLRGSNRIGQRSS